LCQIKHPQSVNYVNTSHSKIINKYKRYKENKRYIITNNISRNNASHPQYKHISLVSVSQPAIHIIPLSIMNDIGRNSSSIICIRGRYNIALRLYLMKYESENLQSPLNTTISTSISLGFIYRTAEYFFFFNKIILIEHIRAKMMTSILYRFLHCTLHDKITLVKSATNST
jgi:hypothetical protein